MLPISEPTPKAKGSLCVEIAKTLEKERATPALAFLACLQLTKDLAAHMGVPDDALAKALEETTVTVEPAKVVVL